MLPHIRFGLKYQANLNHRFYNGHTEDDIQAVGKFLKPLNTLLDDQYTATLTYNPKEAESFTQPRYDLTLTMPDGSSCDVTCLFNHHELDDWVASGALFSVYETLLRQADHRPSYLPQEPLKHTEIKLDKDEDWHDIQQFERLMGPLEALLGDRYKFKIGFYGDVRPPSFKSPIYSIEVQKPDGAVIGRQLFESMNTGTIHHIFRQIYEDLKSQPA